MDENATSWEWPASPAVLLPFPYVLTTIPIIVFLSFLRQPISVPDEWSHIARAGQIADGILLTEAVAEWVRVAKPGGVLSLILPRDPGWAWRMGRYLGPRRQAEKAGLPYDHYMTREHINSIHNLSEILKFHFPKREVTWWPSGIPVADLNLIYAANNYV